MEFRRKTDLNLNFKIPMSNQVQKNKLLVILGPTASGKSDIAIRLAKKFDGEIISADSRQIYRGMNIGTGKVRGKWNMEHGTFVSEKVPHHMINIVSPKTFYNAAKFKKAAEKIIKDILSRGKLPIICGGTGFWIKALVDNMAFPEVAPDWELRNQLRNKTAKELFSTLKKLDSRRAKNIDAQNKVRLIRAIEITKKLGQVPEHKTQTIEHGAYEFLQIGINWPKNILDQRIKKRLEKRLQKGMIKEVQDLHFKDKVSWKRLESFGLEYSWLAQYLQNKISQKEAEEKLYLDIIHYAKRQLTWFKKDPRIIWTNKISLIENKSTAFLKN